MQTIHVDTSIPVADITRKPIGINVNYLRDADANYSGHRPLTAALSEMNVKYLRYPGGEKSDFQLFAEPPDYKPDPQIYGSYRKFIEGYQVLDFDAFMAVVKTVGAIPHVVVGYDSLARTRISCERYLENAVEWVRYANIIKQYGVQNWKIGNENWHNKTGEPEEIAEIVQLFAQAMKRIDPDSGQLSLFFINKSFSMQSISVALNGHQYNFGMSYGYQGSGPDDKCPVWECGENWLLKTR